MRKFALTLTAVATMFVVPMSASSQTFEIGPGGFRVQERGYGRGVDCEELRFACRNKDRLGEEGMGNCRRYRELCQRPARISCRELRDRCENKDLYGEEGRGNCRRYRETCQRY